MKFRHFVSLRTKLTIADCRERLASNIDPQRRSIFTAPGYKGSRPILGSVDENGFRLQARIYYHNSFAPYFNGGFVEQNDSTIVEGFFDMDRSAKVFMRVWLAGAAALGIPIFIISAWEAFQRTGPGVGSDAMDLILPPALILFGIFLPKFGQWLGESQERTIMEFLSRTLSASVIPDPLARAQNLSGRSRVPESAVTK